MAQQLKQKREEVKVAKIETPSPYGSHASMIVTGKIIVDAFKRTQPTGYDKKLLPLNECALLEDERGLYLTDSKRLDDGLADPNRHANPDARVPIKAIADEPTEPTEPTKPTEEAKPTEPTEKVEEKIPERCDKCVSKKVSVNDKPCRTCLNHESNFEIVKKGADKENPTPKVSEVLTTA